MKIYFIRHGETDYNKNLISQGQKPGIPMNQTGKVQAKKTGKYLKNFRMTDGKFDCILSSPLLRARQTAEILADELNYQENIIYDTRLMELGKGVMAGKHKSIRYPIIKKIDEKFKKKINYDPILYYQNKHVLDNKLKEHYDIETIQEGTERGISFINYLKKYCLSNNFKKIIVVSHGGIMRCIFKSLFNIPIAPEGEMKTTSNCFISYIKEKNNRYKMITPPNTWHLNE